MMKVADATTFVGLSVGEFLNRLAAPEPAPGGGSAAALAGACAAGLVAMAAGITLARTREPEDRSEMARVQAEAARLQTHFMRLVDEDVAAYSRFSAAHRLPRISAAEAAARTEAIQCALHGAVTAPLAVADCCLQLLQAAQPAARHGRRLTVPDIAMAALLAQAALTGSIRNAAANLADLHDGAEREHLLGRLAHLAAEGQAALAAVLATADERG